MQLQTITNSILIAAPPHKVFDIASDMEKYPEFMPDVQSVTVLERGDNWTLTDWETDVDGTPFQWIEKDIFDRDKLEINYFLTEGDLEKFEGRWTFETEGQGTKVTLEVTYDFGLPELTALIGPTLKDKIQENSLMMLIAIKAQLEQ